MSELELALIDLGRHIEFPGTPELGPRVRARLGERPERRTGWAVRRTAVIALAVFAVAVAAVMAVPQTRAAILEFFHLRGVTIERVEELPTVPTQTTLDLGSPVELDRVEVPWEVLVPTKLGEPDAAYYRPHPSGGMVSLLYGSPEAPRAILTQFRASVDEAFFKKVLADTRVEPVTVDGQPGYWLSGAPHAFVYLDTQGRFQEESVRLVGNVLLWERGSLTLRLEADVSKAEALKIARSAS